jgi:hypothetical protein
VVKAGRGELAGDIEVPLGIRAAGELVPDLARGGQPGDGLEVDGIRNYPACRA